MSSTPDDLLEQLSTALWRERRLLETLLFKLVEEQLVASSGEDRWLTRATLEVEVVVDQVRFADLGREVELTALVTAIGLPAEVTLSALIEAVEEPWGEILTGHRRAFDELAREIALNADDDRRGLVEAQMARRPTLRWLAGRSLALDPAGRSAPRLRAVE